MVLNTCYTFQILSYFMSYFTDVRTQAMYQMMDQGFVGLIFSCFIEDKNTKVSDNLIKWIICLVIHVAISISLFCFSDGQSSLHLFPVCPGTERLRVSALLLKSSYISIKHTMVGRSEAKGLHQMCSNFQHAISSNQLMFSLSYEAWP